MKNNNSAFTTFLDEKFIPLKPKVKLLIVVLIVLIPAAVFFLSFYQPKTETINNLIAQKKKVESEIQEVKIKAASMKKFEEQLQLAELEFQKTSALLPKEKEIPQLLKDISALGRTAGLDFNTFKPLPDVPKDFYTEIPISINVRGPYHNMGFFFDQVSKLERIVSVTNIKMSSPQREGSEMLLKSDCKLLTYRFTNVELPKKKK